MDLRDRAQTHAALGDVHRLRVVEALRRGDLTFGEAAALTGLDGNRLAHHLDVLEAAGLISRRRSEGDGRRRYLRLDHGRVADLAAAAGSLAGSALFVCTHNSARSPFAAALWVRLTGRPAESAGSSPADRVHPRALGVAREFGVDLSDAVPRGYGDLTVRPELVVSVCDRAHEAGAPQAAERLHWSVPDPAAIDNDRAFRAAFEEIQERITALGAADQREGD